VKNHSIEYARVPLPVVDVPDAAPTIPLAVLERRRDRLCARMRAGALDQLLVYADREHCANFAWLAGFDPRFEEAVAVLSADGTMTMILGNENIGMPDSVGVAGRRVHFPTFSLISQPRSGARPFGDILAECGIVRGSAVGICGWKYYTAEDGCAPEAFETPHWIVEEVKRAAGARTAKDGVGVRGSVVNAGHLFMSPSDGLRTVLEVEQVAQYEYACCLVSKAYRDMLAMVRPGVTERQLAAAFAGGGYPQSVHPMISTGSKARWGLSSPSDKAVELGDFLTSGYGLKGALMARAAFVASSAADLPPPTRSWMEEVAVPYYRTAVLWYETVRAGVSGASVFSLVEKEFPRARFGWTLNPGHFIGDDEWISSPFTSGSAVLRSGSYLQFDLIPDPPAPLAGANMEDGSLIADEDLRAQITSVYPQMGERFARRRKYLKEVLGIAISNDLLPMSDLAGFYTPLLMTQDKALVVA
jgi:hypothetical protein